MTAANNEQRIRKETTEEEKRAKDTQEPSSPPMVPLVIDNRHPPSQTERARPRVLDLQLRLILVRWSSRGPSHSSSN